MNNPKENLPIKSNLYEAILDALSKGFSREEVRSGIGIEENLWILFWETGIEPCQAFNFVEGHLEAIA